MTDTTFKQYEENEDYKERKASEIRAEIAKDHPLLSFDFQSQGPGEHWISISSPEFTAICPFSSWPDFGKIKIEYVPNEKCLELKSFKLYINAFRDVKVFHETVTEIIFQDFLEAIEPKKAKIVINMNVRGNIKTICKKYYNVDKQD